MAAPSILLISNHAIEATSPGYVDALRGMQAAGEISGVQVIYGQAAPGETQSEVDSRVVRGLAQSGCDAVLALSMKRRVMDMEGVQRALSGRTLIYWEGDPWGRGKRISAEMGAWLTLSDWTFTVGGSPQWELLERAGARRLRLTIHTYDHVLFAQAERGLGASEPTHEVCFLGSNLMRFPLVSGVPGSWQRWQTVRRLRDRFGDKFLLGGPGWPGRWSQGRVAFPDQAGFLRRGEVVANWDHYPGTVAYTSDRLAIAMICGRTQVSTRHPSMEWLPGSDCGVFLESEPQSIVETADTVVRAGDALARGRAAHEWAKRRVSHREAVRHMLSAVWSDIEPPPPDPWAHLPDPA